MTGSTKGLAERDLQFLSERHESLGGPLRTVFDHGNLRPEEDTGDLVPDLDSAVNPALRGWYVDTY